MPVPHLRSSQVLLIPASALLLFGCGSTVLSRTGPAQPSREANCEFEMFTTVPLTGYKEIGTIDVNRGWYGQKTHTKIEGFKEEIAPYVCEAGGDAAVATSELGLYLKASVLKHVDEAPAAAEPTPKPSGGCEYDTQCKGERVCVDGACVDPKPSEPAAAASQEPAPAASQQSAPAAPEK